jgi:hypothetical protein
MRKGLLIVAMLTALFFFSCKKERSFDASAGGGGGITSGTLLEKMVIKLGTDSVNALYGYDNQKRLTSYKTIGIIFGSSIDAEIKIVRNTAGIVQKLILKNDFAVNLGIDSIVRIVHYDVSKSRYTSMMASYFDGSDDVKDSTAFTYNAAGKMSQVEYFFDDGVSGGYMEQEKAEYTFDANGNVTKEKFYEFNSSTGLYEQSYQYAYEYDDKINPLYLNNEGFLLGDINTVSSHNINKNTYTDFTDPSQNDVSSAVYTYNSTGRPITLTQTSQGLPVALTTTYYYK